ncbi:MAG: glutathione S-transferase N-terminal domain-containing protein [Pseudodonghicola sp.]
MKLFISQTSPYARFAAVMCIEARLPDLAIVVVDPWDNPAELLAVTPTGRVPALHLPETGETISESLLIADYAARAAGAPAELWCRTERERRIAGLALGAIDAAAAVIAGRMAVSDDVASPAFDASPVGLRRHGAIDRTLDAIDLMLATGLPPAPGIAAVLPVIAADYMTLRFGNRHETTARPHLGALRAGLATVRSMALTRPLVDAATVGRL